MGILREERSSWEVTEEKSTGSKIFFHLLTKALPEDVLAVRTVHSVTIGAVEQPGGACLLSEMEETVRDLMISKFGRVIDLAALQTLSVNTTLEELRIKKLRKELTNAREIKQWEVRTEGT